jgi:sulfur carrier protein
MLNTMVMAVIKISLNGEARDVSGEVTVDQLLDTFSFSKKRIAVEHNGHVIPRTDWPTTVVRDADNIEVVHFVGGG